MLRRIFHFFPAPILLPAMLSCTRGEPPTWDAGLHVRTSDSVSPIPPGPDAFIAIVDAAAEEEDSGALPQTHDRPKPSGPHFDARVEALWDAIAADDPDRAMPFFFPASAYAQVKAITNPLADWKRRLVSNFGRDVHEAHEKLGKRFENAKLVGLDVPMDRARWIEPGEEGNKIGYFRVYGSKLRFENGNASGSIEITSLISWRGEWYVVHLSGFK